MGDMNYDNLEKSLARLKEQYDNYLTLDEDALTTLVGEAIVESTVKRFDICYDTLLKHMKKFMEVELWAEKIGYAPVQIFRSAKENGVIDEDMQRKLLVYRDIRNKAAHGYDEGLPQIVLDIVADFVDDVDYILQTMVDWK